MANLTEMTPVEIDTELAKIYMAAGPLLQKAIQYRQAAIDYRFPTYGPPNERLAAKYDAMNAEAAAAYRAKMDECAPYDGEYDRRGGWTRAFIVTDGHVHSSMNCSTCYPTTQFGWLPEVSGQTEAEIVAQAGEGACTICYPTAPVVAKGTRTLFHADEIAKQAARAEREAAKLVREAAKAAKAIANPDGSPLSVFDWRVPERQQQLRGGEVRTIPAHDRFKTIETLAAAKSWLTDSFDGYTRRTEDIDAVSEAIAHKLGTSAQDEQDAAKKRASKRR